MSTNIHFVAKRKITFKKKNGKRSGEIQEVSFDVWQTPTTTTYNIMSSAEPIQAYKTWILTECSADEKIPVFAEDDIWAEGNPVGVEIYNAGKEHVAKFEQWVEELDEQGYTISAEAW